MTLESLATWLSQITPWSNIVLVGAAIYFLWLTFKGGEHGRTHEDALEKGKELGSNLGGWLKDKGMIPFTKEHREKFGRIGGKYGKRAFKRTLNEFILDKNEYKLIEELEKSFLNTEIEKTKAEASTKETDFENCKKKAEELNKIANKAYKKWKGVKQKTFRQQRAINDVINQLKKIDEIDPAKIQEVQAEEAKILKDHEDTEKALKVIATESELLVKVAEEACEQKTASKPPVFDATSAQNKLKAMNVSNIPSEIKICKDKQESVLKILTDVGQKIQKLL